LHANNAVPGTSAFVPLRFRFGSTSLQHRIGTAVGTAVGTARVAAFSHDIARNNC
jgi:hypothetical protein